MSINKEDQLKFDEGKTTEPLTILKAGLEELEFGSKQVVHIKGTIEGYDHFLPSVGLINKMKEENVDVGDKITIEKVAPTEKYKYGYFTVKVVEKNAQDNKVVMDEYATGERKAVEPVDKGDNKPQIHKSIEKFEEQFKDSDTKLDIHELALRVDALAKEVAILKKNAIPF